MLEKQLPNNIEAEEGILGCLLIAPEDIFLVEDTLRPEHFYRDSHRTIYAAMIHLSERRESCDAFSVCDLLRRQEKLEQVGGAFYINGLVSHPISSTMTEIYAKRVIDTAKRRLLIDAGGKIVRSAYGEEDAEKAIEQAEELVYGISKAEQTTEVVTVGTVFAEFFEQLESLPQGGSIVGVPTGLDELDKKTSGLQKSDLVLLAGRPSMGKTSLCMTIARNTAMNHGRRVFVFSLEMSRLQMIQRLTAIEARVDLHRLRMKQLSADEMERVIGVSGAILDASIWIDDTPAISLVAMRSRIRRMLAQEDIDLIIIDYLQKMQATIDGKRIRERYQEVSEVARGLKNIAREFNIPVLALAQLSREVENRASHVPQLSDLRDSGELEQEADIVIFIHRDEYYAGKDYDGSSKSDRPKTADLIFAKHRNGPVGEVLVGFEESQTRFHNIGEK